MKINEMGQIQPKIVLLYIFWSYFPQRGGASVDRETAGNLQEAGVVTEDDEEDLDRQCEIVCPSLYGK